jgi:hypothetical protein
MRFRLHPALWVLWGCWGCLGTRLYPFLYPPCVACQTATRDSAQEAALSQVLLRGPSRSTCEASAIRPIRAGRPTSQWSKRSANYLASLARPSSRPTLTQSSQGHAKAWKRWLATLLAAIVALVIGGAVFVSRTKPDAKPRTRRSPSHLLRPTRHRPCALHRSNRLASVPCAPPHGGHRRGGFSLNGAGLYRGPQHRQGLGGRWRDAPTHPTRVEPRASERSAGLGKIRSQRDLSVRLCR